MMSSGRPNRAGAHDPMSAENLIEDDRDLEEKRAYERYGTGLKPL